MGDVSRAAKGITNATVVSKETMVSKVIVVTVIQGDCCNNVMKDATDRLTLMGT
jgi:hypothetical protein